MSSLQCPKAHTALTSLLQESARQKRQEDVQLLELAGSRNALGIAGFKKLVHPLETALNVVSVLEPSDDVRSSLT